jgi:hypothetical protein
VCGPERASLPSAQPLAHPVRRAEPLMGPRRRLLPWSSDSMPRTIPLAASTFTSLSLTSTLKVASSSALLTLLISTRSRHCQLRQRHRIRIQKGPLPAPSARQADGGDVSPQVRRIRHEARRRFRRPPSRPFRRSPRCRPGFRSRCPARPSGSGRAPGPGQRHWRRPQ